MKVRQIRDSKGTQIGLEVKAETNRQLNCLKRLWRHGVELRYDEFAMTLEIRLKSRETGAKPIG